MINSKTKIAELHDVIYLHPVTVYNDSTTGVPSRTYAAPVKIYAKIRRTLGSRHDDDKNQVINTWTITVRRDSIVYNIDDRLVWGTTNMMIKGVKYLDYFYREITCENET